MTTAVTSESTVWVDFKQLKNSITIAEVLDHYGVKVRERGKELRAKCPIHEGAADQKKLTFSANTEKNIFQCFVCRKRGDILDFVKAKEGCTLREAGLKLQEWFGAGD